MTLVVQAVQFQVPLPDPMPDPLPDPSSMWHYYRNALLGGEQEHGVLEQ